MTSTDRPVVPGEPAHGGGPSPAGPARPAAATGVGEAAPGPDRVHRRWAVGLTAATVLMMLAASAVALRHVPVAYTDWALIALRVRSVGSSWPLIGAPSNFGLHHPGPLEYYLLAPFHRALGGGPWALGAGTAVLNATAVATASWLAWRRGRLALVVIVLAACATLTAALGAGFLIDDWNPWVALLPSVAFLLAVAAVVDDDPAALPVLVVAGSWSVQAHFSYAVVVVPLAVGAVLVMVGRAWRRRRRRVGPAGASTPAGTDPSGGTDAAASLGAPGPSRLVLGLVATGLLALCWLPPVVDEVAHRPDGNLSATVAHFARPPADTSTLASGDLVGTLATELGWRPPSITGREPVNIFIDNVVPRSGVELLPVALLVVAAIALAVVRRDRDALVLLAVGLLAALLGAFGVARLEPGRVFPHVVRFLWVIDVVLLVAVIWAVTRAARGRVGAVDRAGLVLGLAVLALGLIRLALGAPDVRLPINQPDQSASVGKCVESLGAAARAEADGSPAPEVALDTEEFWPVAAAGVADQLERAGVDVRIGAHLAFYAGVTPTDASPGAPVLLVVDEAGLPGVDARPGWRVVAVCDPLTAAERAELQALRAVVGPGPAEAQRAIDLQARSARFALLAAT